jgi:alpha-L-rhamnosidase
MRRTFSTIAAAFASVVLLAGCRPAPEATTDAVVAPRPFELRTEYKSNPLGIGVRVPRLSWRLDSSRRGVLQSAYQVRVARSEADVRSGQRLVWESSKVSSRRSVQVPYNGAPLESGGGFFWQVRIWDGQDRGSEWSEPAYWELGLLDPVDWKARWIAPGNDGEASQPGPAPLLRRVFTLREGIERARVYATSRGLYEVHLNGKRVGDQLFTPGWTSYHERLQYQTYDVTDLLKPGANAAGAVLGDGWYRGVIGFEGRANLYGERPALLMQLHVVYEDGQEQLVVTDSNWKHSTGPILMSQIYAGEIYDARLEKNGWTIAGYDDRDWQPVEVLPDGGNALVAAAGPPVRRIEDLRPGRIYTTPAGDRVADFNQNLVGWVRLRVQGAAGTRVVLRHGEALDADGNFYTDNLRGARQEVEYILKGGGIETFEPHFTFQGFRYVAIDGYPGDLTPESLTAVVIHSDMEVTGEFETSSPLVNRLQSNIVWSQKGNFLDIPTDCPQRDERLGWTGDAQVFAPTAAFNMDVASFFGKWLSDLVADQYDDGSVPFVVPDVIREFEGRPAGGAAGWADAATIIPWQMYLAYGDRRLLEAQYDSMAAWVNYQRERAGHDLVWDGDFTFGDWLDFFGSAKGTSFGSTSTDLISTAFFAHSTDNLRRAAAVLGKKEDAAQYAELHAQIAAAFAREFVSAAGEVGSGTQTAYVLALQFDLVPEELRATAAANLAEDVRKRGHLTTGFLGTPHLLSVLTRYGYLKEAYMLLGREQFPSWLYPIKHGATTIWERWDGRRADGSFQDPSMNSFNHYAYGAVGSWMYRVMAGINADPAAPGYEHALIQPLPGGGFTYVRGSLETQYGRLGSEWRLEDGRFELTVVVPPNTRATVRLPHALLDAVTESGIPLDRAQGVDSPRQENDAVFLEVGSGEYRFAYDTNAQGRSRR